MKLKKFFTALALASLLAPALMFAESSAAPKFGIVDMQACITKSYLGQQESAKIEQMQNELLTEMQKKHKDLQDLEAKLTDNDYLDTLSPEAEKELESQVRGIHEELQMLQGQAQQKFQEENMRTMQGITTEVNKACEYIAREKGLDYIISKQSCHYYQLPADITPSVIAEMNRHYQPEDK